MGRVVESRLRVRYAETDSMGIVYHANYLIWMEVGRTDYFRQLGFTYKQLESEYNLRTPVVEVNCRYHAPAFYDDDISVHTLLSTANRRLLKFTYRIFRANDLLLLAEGESVHLVVDTERRRTVFPEVLMKVLRSD